MTRQDIISAYRDLTSAFANKYLWGRMGWAEMRGKYRRTTLGPFWATISLAVFIFVLGQVWSRLWGKDIDSFMPYVASGVVSWALISALTTDGVNCFIKYKGLINSIKFPLPLIPFALIWNHITLFFHNILIVVLAGIVYEIDLSFYTLLLIPGLFLIWINGIWVMLLLGIIGTRFRDIHVIVRTIMQMMMFITPIFWTYDRLEGRVDVFFIKLNPFLHYLEIIRQPMLGNIPDMLNYFVVFLLTLSGCLVTLIFYIKYKHRVVYWL